MRFARRFRSGAIRHKSFWGRPASPVQARFVADFREGDGDRNERGFRESGANQFRPSGPESGEFGKMPCFTGSCGW